jgi:hypothetical protein
MPQPGQAQEAAQYVIDGVDGEWNEYTKITHGNLLLKPVADAHHNGCATSFCDDRMRAY